MKMRLRAMYQPTIVLTVLLIFAPQVGTAATEMLDPNANGNVQLTGGSFVLEEDPFSFVTQELLSSDVDARVILEFPLTSLSSSAIITSASLELDVTLFSSPGGLLPEVPVFGYAGDGVAEIDDAAHYSTRIGMSDPITDTVPISINLDVEYISGLLGNSTHLGLLLMGSENGTQAGFANLFGTPPFLKLTLGDPGDFDLDGDVDGDDFLKWQRGESPMPLSAADLMDWENNYGMAPLVASVAAVPETATLGLALIGALGLLARRSPASRSLAAINP